MLKRLRDSEEGFTLIELLVVVIIIGILAAIAIPTFLNQRERGWQAELTSVVRNVALEVEAAATNNNGVPPATFAEVIVEADYPQFGFGAAATDSVTVPAYDVTGSTFTLCSSHNSIDGDNSVTYDSSAGGIQGFEEAAC